MLTIARAIPLCCAGLPVAFGDITTSQNTSPPALEHVVEQLTSLTEQGQPAGDNAWPLLLEAAEILESPEHRAAYFDILFRLNSQPMDDFDQREHAHALRVYGLVKAAGVPELIEQAIACPRMTTSLDDWEGTIPPKISELRVVSTFQCAMMREAMNAEDADAIVRHFAGEMKLAEFASHQPGIVSTLLSIATLARTCEEVRARLINGSLPVEASRPMLIRMNHLAFAPSAKVMESELLIARTLLGHNFDQTGVIPQADRRSLVAAVAKGLSGEFADLSTWGEQDDHDAEQIDLSQWRFPAWNEVDGWLTTAFAELVLREQLPLSQWPAPVAIVVLQTESQRVVLADLAQTMCHAAETILRDRARVLLELRGTMIMLALHLYHSDNGTYPATLNALMPDYLPQLPIDPVNGGQFGYRLLDEDEYGRPYLLYSLGVDNTDNGGRQPHDRTERHRALSRTDGAGFDYVINRPRATSGQ